MFSWKATTVRVKKDIEKLVRAVGDLTGYEWFTIRNYAILLGLNLILDNLLGSGKLYLDDNKVEKLIEYTKKRIQEVMEYVEG